MPDVVVMGAGPAGLTLGCLLAKAGIDHVILERGHHPRPRVGESLLPSALKTFEEIGFLDVLATAGFPPARGLVYHTLDDEDGPIPVGFGEFAADGAGASHSYHADRARLDMLLLKHAESLGCRIVQGAAARSVTFDEDGCARGVVADVGTERLEFGARIVVDATGHQTLMGRQLGLRARDPDLDQIALHAWFEGVDRGPRETSQHTHVFFLPIHRGWAWQSPVSDDLTAVGLVTDRAGFQQWKQQPDAFFRACAESHGALSAALASARPVQPLRAETSVNYALERVCGEGWLAVGDAARFVDPVFSSGVGMAVGSARLAADSIGAALDQPGPTGAALQPYQDRMFASAAVWRDFVRLFYRLMPAFTVFLRSPRHRPGLLRLLQGHVERREEAMVLDEMRALVRDVETHPDHPLHLTLREVP